MFKKVFKVLTQGFGHREAPKAPAKPVEQPAARGGVLDKLTAPPTPPASAASVQPAKGKPAPVAAGPAKSPEELCGVTAKMSKDEIKSRLALLYRRFNRATSSLDAKMRAEADSMLDAIVVVREKTFGPI